MNIRAWLSCTTMTIGLVCGNGAMADSHIQVTGKQSLYDVARQIAPNYQHAVLSQVVLALYQSNPDAFVNGNIDALKRDVSLVAPTETEIDRLSPTQASQQLKLVSQLSSPDVLPQGEPVKLEVARPDAAPEVNLTPQPTLTTEPPKASVAKTLKAPAAATPKEAGADLFVATESPAPVEPAAEQAPVDDNPFDVPAETPLQVEAIQPAVEPTVVEPEPVEVPVAVTSSNSQAIEELQSQLLSLNQTVSELQLQLQEANERANVMAAQPESPAPTGIEANYLTAMADTLSNIHGSATDSSLILRNKPAFIGMVLYVALMLLALILGPAKSERYAPINEQEQPSSEDEDDFDLMSSPEGLPTKLDLARAYVDMDEKEQAMQILDDVLNSGDVDAIQEANRLIRQMQSPKQPDDS